MTGELKTRHRHQRRGTHHKVPGADPERFCAVEPLCRCERGPLLEEHGGRDDDAAAEVAVLEPEGHGVPREVRQELVPAPVRQGHALRVRVLPSPVTRFLLKAGRKAFQTVF